MTQATTQRSSWTDFDLPPRLSGRVRDLADIAGWQVEKSGATWRACTRENYLRQSPVLLSARPVATPELRGNNGYDILGTLMDQEHLGNPQIRAMVDDEIQRLQGRRDEITVLIALFQLLFTNTPTNRLASAIRGIADDVLTTIPDSQLFLVDLAPELNGRYTLVRALLTAYVDTLIDELPAGRATTTTGVFGGLKLLDPALLALAPFVCGVAAPRARATGVWLFGRPIAGMVWPSSQVIDATRPMDERFSGKRQRSTGLSTPVTGAQLAVFLRWWVGQVNRVLGIATDPRLFSDKSTGHYDPRRHMAYLASLERLFHDVHEILYFTEQSEAARLRAAYDALDCLDGMRLGSFADFMTPTKVKKAIETLEASLPVDVAAVVMPACRDAADALDQVSEGFYPSPLRGPDGLTGLPSRANLMSWDRAIPAYLRIDRNSAHSFLKELDPDQEPEKLAIFLSHTGEIPIKLASIAFLWLVVHLADPSLLETRLMR